MKLKLNLLEDSDETVVRKACSMHYKSKKCKSCKTYKQLNNKMTKKNGKVNSKAFTKISNQCDKCVSNNLKKCNSRQLKKYSKWYYGN